jgi:predicted transcriptional regulator
MSDELGARERQIMDVVYRLARASVSEVLAELADPPTYSAVRGMLGLLEDKGLLRHEQDGLKYVYLPTVKPEKARKSALRHLVHTFFGGSAQAAAAALLELPDESVSGDDLARLRKLVSRAGKRKKEVK